MAPTQAVDVGGRAVPNCFKWGTTQTVTTGATSQQSAAVTGPVVRVVCSAHCKISVGENPTAGAGSAFLVANVPEYIQVSAGHKIAAIQFAAGGYLWITELE